MKMSERKIDLSIEVNAPVEAVWRALTEGEELSRWFAPAARVNPGKGGTVWLSWGPGVEGEGRIEVWEPNRALRVSEGASFIDYLIEKRGSAVVLRIVHSGFGEGASFDDQYESTLGGWNYFMFNLKHYLERHAGQPRHMITVRRQMSNTREDAWPELLHRLQLKPNTVQQGGSYEVTLGDRAYSGTVISIRPARSFTGTVKELNDGLLFIELESGNKGWHCGIWLSVYGAEPKVDDLERALGAVLISSAAPHEGP
jgi:uncharacterized protein YndB with AHSA1/START domain